MFCKNITVKSLWSLKKISVCCFIISAAMNLPSFLFHHPSHTLQIHFPKSSRGRPCSCSCMVWWFPKQSLSFCLHDHADMLIGGLLSYCCWPPRRCRLRWKLTRSPSSLVSRGCRGAHSPADVRRRWRSHRSNRTTVAKALGCFKAGKHG